MLLVGVAGTGYAAIRHLNGNIHQDNIGGLLDEQISSSTSGAQNILLIGTGSPVAKGGQGELSTGTVSTHMLMLLHIQAQSKWAEVMSIPSNTSVAIPSCTMSNGKQAAPTSGPINEAFTIGNRHGNRTTNGVACLVKTFQQATGIRISHFILDDLNGLQSAVSALNGVRVCNPSAVSDPAIGFSLPAGCNWLSPTQAVDDLTVPYVVNPHNSMAQVADEQALASGLVTRAKGELYNPLATFRFADAVTQSLTIDSQLGGIFGLYHLWSRMYSIPSSRITLFDLPLGSKGGAGSMKEPEDSRIFADLRADLPATRSFTGRVESCTVSQRDC